jgi:hypothetical protein
MAEIALGTIAVGITSTVQSAGGAGAYAGALSPAPPSSSRDYLHGGTGFIASTVKEKNTPIDTPLRRRVRLYRDSDGLLLRQTWSDATTGNYRIDDLDPAQRYTVIGIEHLHNYRAVLADNLTPEVSP